MKTERDKIDVLSFFILFSSVCLFKLYPSSPKNDKSLIIDRYILYGFLFIKKNFLYKIRIIVFVKPVVRLMPDFYWKICLQIFDSIHVNNPQCSWVLVVATSIAVILLLIFHTRYAAAFQASEANTAVNNILTHLYMYTLAYCPISIRVVFVFLLLLGLLFSHLKCWQISLLGKTQVPIKMLSSFALSDERYEHAHTQTHR